MTDDIQLGFPEELMGLELFGWCFERLWQLRLVNNFNNRVNAIHYFRDEETAQKEGEFHAQFSQSFTLSSIVALIKEGSSLLPMGVMLVPLTAPMDEETRRRLGSS